jgi:hypothetical protein
MMSFGTGSCFFNYLPDGIGAEEARYKCGTTEQIERASRRLLQLLEKYTPHKILVFTNAPEKGWQTFPRTLEETETPPKRCLQLGPQFPENFTWGTYQVGARTVKAFGLRHPQGANRSIMEAAVREILAVQ